MERIKAEIPEPRDATSVDVKKVTRKLKHTEYIENFHYILLTISGQEPPYIRREVEGTMVRLFKQIDRIYSTISHDKCESSLTSSSSFWSL